MNCGKLWKKARKREHCDECSVVLMNRYFFAILRRRCRALLGLDGLERSSPPLAIVLTTDLWIPLLAKAARSGPPIAPTAPIFAIAYAPLAAAVMHSSRTSTATSASSFVTTSGGQMRTV